MDRHAYTVLVGHKVQQKVYKHAFPTAIRLKRMETERESTSIYRTEWQIQPQMDEHKPTTKHIVVVGELCLLPLQWREKQETRFRFCPCEGVLQGGGYLLSQDFLPVMKPEICLGSWPSVATAISSWPRDNQNNSRLFRSVSTSAKSGSCTDGNV